MPLEMRLSFRRERDWWVCYIAPPVGTEGALEIGRIRMMIAEQDLIVKQRFMDLMKEALGVATRETFGATPEWPNPPIPAPEDERKK